MEGGHPREMGAHRKEKLASTTEERESGQEGELSPLLSLVGFAVSWGPKLATSHFKGTAPPSQSFNQQRIAQKIGGF